MPSGNIFNKILSTVGVVTASIAAIGKVAPIIKDTFKAVKGILSFFKIL